jgi:formiminotetrahydrofolate cyclodeaminase
MLKDLGFIELLDEIASKSPAPGGGSAAAMAGAIGCSLLCMVSNLTIGRKKYADVEPQVQEILAEAAKLRERFVSLIDEDKEAFMELFKFFKLKEMTPEQEEQMKQAEARAIGVPQQIMETALAAMKLAEKLAVIGNKNAISDVGVAVYYIRTAFKGGELNVRINLAGKNAAEKEKYLKWMEPITFDFRESKKAAKGAVTYELGM